MRNKHSKRMKTLAELREGIEDIIKPDKLKYYTDSDWIKKKLTEFVIKQDKVQDRKDSEKNEAPLPDNVDKGRESEKLETPAKEPENTEPEEPKTRESAKSLPIKDDKIEGEVHVIIYKLHDEIEDNIRSKVGFFLYDVVYEGEVVGTLKITSKSLKELAVNPYDYTSATLSLEDKDLNIKIRAERDVKESLYVNEAMSNTGFGAIIGGITGLFSGRGSIFTLGSTIFGAVFGSIRDNKNNKENGEQEPPLWKRIVQQDAEDRKAIETKLKEVRGGFISSMNADDFKDEDVYNAMNFFYDPETGLPRSADDIRKAMEGCDQKDIDALIEKASKYREDNEDEVKAFNEWTKNLPKEKLDEVDKLNKMNFEELSATKEVERIDKDIKTLESEMKKIEDSEDEVSRRAYNKMQEELDEKKSSRTKAVDKVRDIQSSKKSQQEKVDEITKDHPLPDEITNNRKRQQVKQELVQQKKADAEQKKDREEEPEKKDEPKKDDEPEKTDRLEKAKKETIKDPNTGEKIKVKVQRAHGVRGGKKYRIKRDGQWGEWYYGEPTQESLQNCEDIEIVAEGCLKTLKELR